MKKSEVKIGEIYFAKVSGKIVKVRLTAEKSSGGYFAINLSTNRQIFCRTAARLRPRKPGIIP